MKRIVLVSWFGLVACALATEPQKSQKTVMSVAVPVGSGITALIQVDGKLDLGASPGVVVYDKQDQVKRVGDAALTYDNEGRIKKMGLIAVIYDTQGRVKRIGNLAVGYDAEGRVSRIGTSSLKYHEDGSVKMVSPMDGAMLFVGME